MRRPPRDRREYTADLVREVITLAQSIGIRPAAEQMGVPVSTVHKWVSGQARQESLAEADASRGSMADALERIAWLILDALPEKIEKANLQQAATSAAIAIDKARLLRGEPSSITSTVTNGVDISATIRSDPEACRHAVELLGRLTGRAPESRRIGLVGEPGPVGEPAALDAPESDAPGRGGGPD